MPVGLIAAPAQAITSVDGEVRVAPGSHTLKGHSIVVRATCAATGPGGTAEGGAPCLTGNVTLQTKAGEVVSKQPVPFPALESGEQSKLKVVVAADERARLKRKGCLQLVAVAERPDAQGASKLLTTITIRYSGKSC